MRIQKISTIGIVLINIYTNQAQQFYSFFNQYIFNVI